MRLIRPLPPIQGDFKSRAGPTGGRSGNARDAVFQSGGGIENPAASQEQTMSEQGGIRALTCTSGDLRRKLAEGETLHRAFRPRLPADYTAHMETMLGEGAHLAQLVDAGNVVVALALWRSYLTTYDGRILVVDDLVTDETVRSRGHGHALLHWLEERARLLECNALHLVPAFNASAPTRSTSGSGCISAGSTSPRPSRNYSDRTVALRRDIP
jgi:GNAT superfamily N-acetyltransferase